MDIVKSFHGIQEQGKKVGGIRPSNYEVISVAVIIIAFFGGGAEFQHVALPGLEFTL